MTANGVLQIVFYFVLLLLLTIPLGVYMARVYQKERTFLDFILVPIERLCYRFMRVNPDEDMHWTRYTFAVLAFSIVSFLAVYLLQRLQSFLPFNPQKLGAVEPSSAFNTAVSFMSNTNWQSYTPEGTMSYLSQMAGLAVQNFVSAAVGMAVSVALIRGFVRREAQGIGNFWFDLVRSTLWVLVPLSLIMALVLVWQGVPQNLQPYVTAQT